MTLQEREDIFSKECLGIKDIMELFGIAYPTASEWIRKAKLRLSFKQELRVNMQGKIHTLDYFDLMGIEYGDRYKEGKAV